MENFKRQSTSDLQRSRSYNSFLESQPQLPPLYNRPAHLPHQQSLTSLLRPGSHTSRSSVSNFRTAAAGRTGIKSSPGTPEQLTSDDLSEAGSSAAAGYFSTAGPGYLKPSIVPTYEYYGFVLYLTSTVLFGLYLIWGLLGPEVLERYIGDLGYPVRWWALAVPAWSLVLLIYVYIALACYNTQVLTPELKDHRTMSDTHAKICGSEMAEKWDQGTDAVLDLPVSAVCDALYNERHEGSVTDDD